MNHQADVFCLCTLDTWKIRNIGENMTFSVMGSALRFSSIFKRKNKHHRQVISTRSLTKEKWWCNCKKKKEGKFVEENKSYYIMVLRLWVKFNEQQQKTKKKRLINKFDPRNIHHKLKNFWSSCSWNWCIQVPLIWVYLSTSYFSCSD